MREEVHEMSVEKRKAIYQKRMKEYQWGQISLSVLIIIVGILASRQFLKLDITSEMFETAKKVIHYLVLMMTLAGLQVATHMGQHCLKSVPWMKEFSENQDKKETTKGK